MRPGWLVSVQSLVFALLLHAAALVLLLVSFSFTPELKPVKPVSIVSAVTVDKAKVEEEVRRLKQEDEKKQKQAEALEKKLEAEKKKAEEIKNQRIEEENQLSIARKQKEEAQKKHEEMQQKVAELEQQRKLEEEKKAKAETEKKQLEGEKKAKAEVEKKKIESELKKKEEEKKRQEAEKAMQEQLEAEQTEQQKQQNTTLLQKIVNDITNKVIRNFNKSGLPDNLGCKLMVKLLPNGEVANVSVIKTSGNEIFDRRALLAVEKSSPFILPEEVDLEKFEQLDLRELSFNFIPPKD
jgi:colicin import membrane protein